MMEAPEKLKPSLLWSVIAFLLGVSLFCVFKSLELLKKNNDLVRSVDEAVGELLKTQTTLQETEGYLKESRKQEARIQGEIEALKIVLDRQEKEIQQHVENISLLSEKLNETVKANAALVAQSQENADRLMRLEFENSEMKTKLSSVHELKKAIKELRTKTRHVKEKKGIFPVEEKRVLRVPEIKVVPKEDLLGNKGFLVRDGKSTYLGIIDIQVVPVESGTL